ncbi:hypothetical protein ACFUJY_22300 [Streptomyces sp. NPDC057249]|uniref:hypothetical protein n=1 Tax=Streptomyces sp. NPDC057249 TaxID=3346067 RepID=UPI00363565E7
MREECIVHGVQGFRHVLTGVQLGEQPLQDGRGPHFVEKASEFVQVTADSGYAVGNLPRAGTLPVCVLFGHPRPQPIGEPSRSPALHAYFGNCL